jgi:predicted nucleic acid-binding protein
MPVLVDTGILYALADEDDDWHERARAWLDDQSELLVVPVTVLPEVAYLLHARLGAAAEAALARSLVAGELDVEGLRPRDLERCVELMRRYPEMGLVDVSIVAIAERLKVSALATTDRRHFRKVAPRHVAAFGLLP